METSSSQCPSQADGFWLSQILFIGLYEHVNNEIFQTRDIFKILGAAGEYIQFALHLFLSYIWSKCLFTYVSRNVASFISLVHSMQLLKDC